MNKELWSPSYLFFMAGVSGYLLVVFYAIYDLQLGADGDSPPMWQHGLRIAFAPGMSKRCRIGPSAFSDQSCFARG